MLQARLASVIFRGRARQADGAHHQSHAPLLGGEDVLDPAAYACPCRIAAGDVRRRRLAARLGALELRDQAALLDQCQVRLAAVGGVRPHLARRVRRVEHVGKLAAVVTRRVR
ncbi:MAG TPA: hypothetical protein VHT74_17435, partial [Acetobacteraceae bacterium]|nr:hypothetical protein [Acetobacteraceae bacterium]